MALPDGVGPFGLDLLAGPAMGSGRMPWTRALLAALERHLVSGMRVADVGTGTGVVGLVALKRGAREADGVDTDPLACAVARRNARRNGLDLNVVEELGEGYDLVLVSLGGVEELPGVLPGIVARTRGVLVASPAEGAEETTRLSDLLRGLDLPVVDDVEVEGWHALVARVSSSA